MQVTLGLRTFAALEDKPSPPALSSMSKVRIPINPKQVGKVGAYSMYVRDGEQIVRQRQNASNYGDQASRTLAQQTRRVKWSNLVALFKAISAWQPKAYELLNAGQTDYNKYMSLNINSANVALTRQQALDGATVVAPVVVSQGSLVSPGAFKEAGLGISTELRWGTEGTASFATIGELSQAIIDNNAGWQNGDNLAAIYLLNWLDTQGTPRCSSVYNELTLDTASTDALSTNILASRMTFVTGGDGIDIAAAAAEANDVAGWAVIHSRRNASSLKVSTERIVMVNDDILNTFITTTQLEAAIESYGLSVEAPLEPSFKKAVIESVAVDGSEVLGPKGGNLNYDHGIRLSITGRNMTPETVWLVHDGIPYTPLEVDGNTWTYVLGSNGSNMIWLNGMSFARVTLSGITVPEGLPTTMQATLYNSNMSPQTKNLITRSNVDCVNYPYMVDASYTSFYIRIGKEDDPISAVESDFVIVNGGISSLTRTGPYTFLFFAPLNADEICYVTYKGYIIFVCNYAN